MPSVMISSTEFKVGRHPECDLHLSNPRLSEFHCRIERSCNENNGAMEVHLTDLSTSGTFINGQKLGTGSSKKIQNGDEIYLLMQDSSTGVT